ncbi:Hypothetical_protein [Hexamita inflata]|uniref:Hypothetical_protein n=1 Tax=Hexamita inflata TaxID=28002 RepID=A0AA86NVI0_9EUKA|nr:Hypothetical protein HINF_LOCUS14413 [Hexamita inflata]
MLWSLKNSRVFMPKCFRLIGVQRACLGQVQGLRFSQTFASLLLVFWFRKTSVVAIEIVHNNLFLNIDSSLVRLAVICILGEVVEFMCSSWLGSLGYAALEIFAQVSSQVLPTLVF